MICLYFLCCDKKEVLLVKEDVVFVDDVKKLNSAVATSWKYVKNVFSAFG